MPLKKRLFFIFCTLVLSLAILEALAILLEPLLLNSFYQYDPDLGFRVRPYAGESNRFGFNDRDYPLKKDKNVYRVLIVSDSFNWADGREGNYTALLEKKFDNHCGRHCVDVINAGYSMTHTGEQLGMLKKFGLPYNPDLVFLGFFAGNDFWDALPYRKRIVILGAYIDIDKRTERTFLGHPVILQSRLFHIIKHYFTVLTKYRLLFQKANKDERREDTEKERAFSREDFLDIERNRLNFCNLKANKNQVFLDRIQYIFQSLSDMRDLLKERNIDFIVGIYPDVFQVNRDLQEDIFKAFQLKESDYDIDLAQKLLKIFLDAEGIPYVDMLDDFRLETQKQPLYKLRDTHWNEAGQNLAAEIIFKHLMGLDKINLN